jgi:hypothetical protein
MFRSHTSSNPDTVHYSSDELDYTNSSMVVVRAMSIHGMLHYSNGVVDCTSRDTHPRLFWPKSSYSTCPSASTPPTWSSELMLWTPFVVQRGTHLVCFDVDQQRVEHHEFLLSSGES